MTEQLFKKACVILEKGDYAITDSQDVQRC